MMEINWEAEIGRFLTQLSGVQQELLDVLADKRRMLAAFDVAGLESLLPREQELAERLADCQRQRCELLQRAAEANLAASDLRSLSATLPAAQRRSLEQPTREAALRARLLAHQGLSNWVAVQRTLLHLSQLLEIIATGGRLKPTYGKEHTSTASGSFVDQAA
jgi:hypothetical protein